MRCNISNRSIFCADNLEVLRGINANCIALIYLDPPFNKKKQFTAAVGSSAEGASFSDTFRAADVKEEWVQTIQEDNEQLYDFLLTIRRSGHQYNFAYLVYMAIRLIEMHRVLKDTGSLYLHCDSTMSHYLKLLLDCVFGEKNFRNEIVWCYKTGGASKKQFSRKHDVLFFYSKSKDYTFNSQQEKSYMGIGYSTGNAQVTLFKDKKFSLFGLHTLVNMKDWWKISMLATSDKKERTGYPTQKPIKLLQRIIKASSNEEDLVLDPFCGCATTCIAAELLGRKWAGIDVSLKTYALVQRRLKKEVANPANMFADQKALHFSTSPPLRTEAGYSKKEQKYVYVISNKQYPGEYKVGIAKNWKARLNAYQTSDPNRGYTLDYKLLTPHFRVIAQHIHTLFENKHEWVKGELNAIKDTLSSYQEK